MGDAPSNRPDGSTEVRPRGFPLNPEAIETVRRSVTLMTRAYDDAVQRLEGVAPVDREALNRRRRERLRRERTTRLARRRALKPARVTR